MTMTMRAGLSFGQSYSTKVTVLSQLETLWSWGPSVRLLYKEISRQLVDTLRDQRAGSFFVQRISNAIQRGNAASLLGTFPGDIDA